MGGRRSTTSVRTIVAIAALIAVALAICGVGSASAASPVTTVKCSLSDDGAGFTSAFLSAGDRLDRH
jgi:hypothetical protein